MVIPSSAPTGEAPRPPRGLPSRGPNRGSGRPGAAPYRPQPSRRRLTSAQRTKLRLVSALVVLAGVVGGLVATLVLPHVYGARVSVLFNLGSTSSSSSLADTTLTTQTLLITSDEVLQPISASSGVPLDYLRKNVSATLVANTDRGTSDDSVPNSQLIQIQVNHPDRNSGVQLANAIAKQYIAVADHTNNDLVSQINTLQGQIADPSTPPASLPDLQSQINDLQTQLAQNLGNNNLASVIGPAYSVAAPVFPNTLITLGIGAVVGALGAGLVGSRMVARWTQRRATY